MSKITVPEIGSYAGAASAIWASLTLAEIGVIVGIATAILTFMLNALYMRRKDAREQRQADLAVRESEARLAAIGVKKRASPFGAIGRRFGRSAGNFSRR